MHLIRRQTCRVCGSRALTRVIDLGMQHLQGSFVKSGKRPPPMRTIPCTLVRCDPALDERACGLLQMEHTVPPEVLYSSYWYRSGTNRTMRDHLAGIAREAVAMTGLAKGIALDIGCNDGTLLDAYPATARRIGIDPADLAIEAAAKFEVVRDLFPSPELHALLGTDRCDIVTSIAMFYDLEDPVTFCSDVAQALAPDGLWIFEMSYMPSMLELTSYDTICHEHLEYYSLAVIEGILSRAGLKLVRGELNPINGGSLRCYATLKTCGKYRNDAWLQQIAELRKKEFDLELDTDKPYKNFQNRINVHRERLVKFLKDLKAAGKKIHVYGASTKGNTILQWCGIDHRLVDCAADRNPEKHGAHTIGTDIPIVSEEESRALRPDYYLVLPWHFREEFLDRERTTMQNGTALIFPLPEIRVYKYEKGDVKVEML